METYDLFILQKYQIQDRWVKHLKKLDKKIESSLLNSVKNTLNDLAKHIKGENVSSASNAENNGVVFVPIFRVFTMIDP